MGKRRTGLRTSGKVIDLMMALKASLSGNQCDGCRRGLTLRDGLHYEDPAGPPYIGCTADRYTAALQEAPDNG